MSHTSKSQESKRKHGKTPDGNDNVLRLLKSIQSEQVEPPQPAAHVAAGDVPFLPQFVTVKDMNYTGEVLRGKWDGTHYLLDDGDCYTAERLADEYGAVFSDTDPAKDPT